MAINITRPSRRVVVGPPTVPTPAPAARYANTANAPNVYAPNVYAPVDPRNVGVQASLDEAGFRRRLDGFREVSPDDLLAPGAKGGRVRYAIDTVDRYGRVTGTAYRLGGYLVSADPQLRYLRLYNPFTKQGWSAQLKTPGKRVRLYFMPRGTSDEVAMMRELLDQHERGEIVIERAPGR